MGHNKHITTSNLQLIAHIALEDVWSFASPVASQKQRKKAAQGAIECYIEDHFWSFLGIYHQSHLSKIFAAQFNREPSYGEWMILNWLHVGMYIGFLRHDNPKPLHVMVDSIYHLALYFGYQQKTLKKQDKDFLWLSHQKQQLLQWLSRFFTYDFHLQDLYRTHPAIRGAMDLATTLNYSLFLLQQFQLTDNITLQPRKQWHQHQELILQTAIWLAWSDNHLHAKEKKALREQISMAILPYERKKILIKALKTGISKQTLFAQLDKQTLHPMFKRGLIATALISSIYDGEQTAPEKKAINQLAHHLHVQQEDITVIKFEILNQLEQTPLRLRSQSSWLLRRYRQLVLDDMYNALLINKDRLIQELKETQDLSFILTKLVRGHSLSDDEKKRAKEQLLDIAKVIPSLAVFSLPGGLVILGVLIKLLPFNLLPSSFQNKE